MQAPETYNLDGILKEMQKASHPSEYHRGVRAVRGGPQGLSHHSPTRNGEKAWTRCEFISCGEDPTNETARTRSKGMVGE